MNKKMFVKKMLGLVGNELVAVTTASNATYTVAVDIESRIAALGDIADIDGNGHINALTDVMLTFRYLFCLEENTLIDGLVADDASRKSTE